VKNLRPHRRPRAKSKCTTHNTDDSEPWRRFHTDNRRANPPVHDVLRFRSGCEVRRAIHAEQMPISTVRARVWFPRGPANPPGTLLTAPERRHGPWRRWPIVSAAAVQHSRPTRTQSYGGGAQLGWRGCSPALVHFMGGSVGWGVRNGFPRDPPLLHVFGWRGEEGGAAADAWARWSSEGQFNADANL
jgi:hypothetical protein